MLNYCCDKFEEGLRRDKRNSPNIRIVKFVSERLVSPSIRIELPNNATFYYEKSTMGPYRFYITTGYTNFNFDVPSFFIEFCPFCGTNLYQFYTRDEYASEIEGVTFSKMS
jgi:hypothetical protein